MEIQDLMSQYNKNEALAAAVFKKMKSDEDGDGEDDNTSVINKI